MIEDYIKRVYTRRDKRNVTISKNLLLEIKRYQELMKKEYRRKKKRNGRINMLQASDLIADIVRRKRYKLQK